MTKTFKIGEYAIGGIIQYVATSTEIKIQAVDWNKPSRVIKQEFFKRGDWAGIDNFLNELTSSYYADKVLTHIKQHA